MMFHRFFMALRDAGLPVSLREYLTLLEGLDKAVISDRVDEFYLFARAALIKDERHLDRFDQVFGHVFRGLEALSNLDDWQASLPDDWLMRITEKNLTDEEKAAIEALGGWDKLMDALKERLDHQQKRHEGGSRNIGTAGTSPFGAYGYNPEGVRIGQRESRHRRAVKVWDKRRFADLDDTRKLDTRDMQMALRKLRRLARVGTPDELDLDGTISASARAGYIDIKMRPEARNAVKILLLLDVGGSMDDHVRLCGQLFSAARSEFKRMDFFYFHNCIYERVWKENARRFSASLPTWEVFHTFAADTRVIVVGDASMSPYEIAVPGGSVEHMNPEAGGVWLQRLTRLYPKLVWLNPEHEARWQWTPSIDMIANVIGRERMVPLTLAGLDRTVSLLR
jgi:uncharacterized protein